MTFVPNIFTTVKLTDRATCYNVDRAELLQRFPLTVGLLGIEVELTAHLAAGGGPIWELPISYSGRTYAEGKKITWRDGVSVVSPTVRSHLVWPPGPGRYP